MPSRSKSLQAYIAFEAILRPCGLWEELEAALMCVHGLR